jgi:hypothetical protein
MNFILLVPLAPGQGILLQPAEIRERTGFGVLVALGKYETGESMGPSQARSDSRVVRRRQLKKGFLVVSLSDSSSIIRAEDPACVLHAKTQTIDS